MPSSMPVLHLICGKIAAGKSTLARRLADKPATVMISEDRCLARLYPGQINSIDDYLRCAGLLRDVMGEHVVSLLRSGLSVVLDFPANTPGQRQWMRQIFEAAGATHELHYLDLPDEVCKARLRQRNAEGAHDFAASDDEFDAITAHFAPPASDEGFNVTVYADR